MITIETVRYGDRPKFDLRVSEDGEYKFTGVVREMNEDDVDLRIVWNAENPPVPVLSTERNMAVFDVLKEMGYKKMYFQSHPDQVKISRARVSTGLGRGGVQYHYIDLEDLDQWR